MICYRDTTFCVSPGCTNQCGRKLTPQIRADAIAWWGSDDAPICVSRFCDKAPEREPVPPKKPRTRADVLRFLRNVKRIRKSLVGRTG